MRMSHLLCVKWIAGSVASGVDDVGKVDDVERLRISVNCTYPHYAGNVWIRPFILRFVYVSIKGYDQMICYLNE